MILLKILQNSKFICMLTDLKTILMHLVMILSHFRDSLIRIHAQPHV